MRPAVHAGFLTFIFLSRTSKACSRPHSQHIRPGAAVLYHGIVHRAVVLSRYASDVVPVGNRPPACDVRVEWFVRKVD